MDHACSGCVVDPRDHISWGRVADVDIYLESREALGGGAEFFARDDLQCIDGDTVAECDGVDRRRDAGSECSREEVSR